MISEKLVKLIKYVIVKALTSIIFGIVKHGVVEPHVSIINKN